jgi:hypothetical protein
MSSSICHLGQSSLFYIYFQLLLVIVMLAWVYVIIAGRFVAVKSLEKQFPTS